MTLPRESQTVSNEVSKWPCVCFLAGGFGPDGVPLHAERSGLEGIGAAAVVEGVENDLDLVVVEDIFAARHAGAHFLGVVEADEHGVKIFLVVAEIGVGRFGDGFAIVRIALHEAGDLRHLQGDVALRLHGQEVVERGRREQVEEW